MASPQYVVVELRVDASNAEQGAAQYSAALDKAAQAADALTSSANKTQQAVTSQSNSMVQAKAANDNLASGYKAANDNFNSFGKSLADHAIDFLNNVNHLKLLALGAYALSPAFRSFANEGLSAAIRLVGVNINLVESAVSGLVRVAAPALAFFSSIAVPIAAAVAVFTALNYVWSTGSALLSKYAQSFRVADISDDLKTLTKYQNDLISASQVQLATQLGARLQDAERTIGDFFKIHFDVTNLALKLQSVWVGIVEAIAGAVTKMNELVNAAPAWLGDLASALTMIARMQAGLSLPGANSTIGGKGDFNTSSAGGQVLQNERDYRAAIYRLSVGMGAANVDDKDKGVGTTFDARFGASIHDLANVDNSNNNKTNSYDRAKQSIEDQIAMLALEANGASKTSQAYEELKVSHTLNIAAMKAGKTPTDEMRAEWKALGDQIADYTIKLNQAHVVQEQTFQSATMFMSPSQLAAANAAKQIDPTNWQAHLKDAGPQMAAFNSELSQARDLSVSFADNFGQAMLQGKTATQALASALTGLESQLINMISKQLVNQAFGGLFGAGSAGLFGSLFGGGSIPTVTGGAGLLAVPTLASGGMVGIDGARRYVHPAYFENAPHFGSGGMITDSGVPIVAHPGERILNASETRAYNSSGAGGSPITVTIAPQYNFPTNADPAFRAEMIARIDNGNKQAVAQAVQAVARVKKNNPNYLA